MNKKTVQPELIRICIVDDDQLAALSLKTILSVQKQIEIAGVGHSGSEAVSLYEKFRPDVLLMDIHMSEMSGLEAGSIILKQYPDAKILLLTTFDDVEYIVKALRMGVKGYILKQNFESILPAVLAVQGGQTVFGDAITERLPELMSRPASPGSPEGYGLTEKDWQIIRLVADGMNNKEIAAALFLSEGTVRNYLSAILEKLELRDRTQLAVFYYKTMG